MKKAFWRISLALLAVALSFGEMQIPKQQAQKQPLFRPDLVVTGIDFQKVQSGSDSQGKTYWIFNVTAKIKNQGNGNAGAFKVLVERNNGAGGAWQTACQTCTIDVSGLAAGAEMTTAARQFNNANAAPSKFRFTADSAGQVSESNELNNSLEETFFQVTAPPGGGGLSPIAKPDLTVVSFDFRDVISATVAGGKIVITFKLAATVKNLGPGSAPASKLYFQASADGKVGTSWIHCDVPPLGAGAQTDITSEPQTYEVGTSVYAYYMPCIDMMSEIAETNESNNCLGGYKKIPGVK